MHGDKTGGYGPSSLSAYLRVLSRRKWVVLTCAVLVPAVAVVLSLRQTPLYQSSAEVYINKQNIASALTGIEDTTLFVDEERAAETQASLASTPRVAELALTFAGVTDRTADDLVAQSSVAPKGLTDILDFTVTDPDPATAQRLATAYANAFVTYRGRLDTQGLVLARREVQRALKTLAAEDRKATPLYQSLEEKQQQLQTLQTLQTSRAYVTRLADPGVKVSPQPVRNAVLGLALGLVLGVGLAFALDALDTRVRSASEISELLDLPLVGRVPPPPKKLRNTDELVMVVQPTGPSSESFRTLRTNLEFARLGSEAARTILITSAVEQEGKSTTAANLAVAMARGGAHVALVDLDLRRPYLHRFFHLLHAQGVTDVALGRVTLDAALEQIDLALGRSLATGLAPLPVVDHVGGNGNGHGDRPEAGSLDVLVAGAIPPDPGEFVGTRKLEGILKSLAARYDSVIVDSPPVLRVGDALTLSKAADAILVVSRLSVVKRPGLSELRRLLETTPIPRLGFVATGSARNEDSAGTYGAYGYGYGYPPREEDREQRGAEAPVA